MGDYCGKAAAMDRLLGGGAGKGRVKQRLDQFGELIGLVSGLFNEASSDFHQLLDVWLRAGSKRWPQRLD